MINIKSIQELEGELDIGDYGGYFCDYADTNEYISDIITEIADNHVSIYYSDILKFVSENPDSLNEVIESGLYDPTCNYDFYSHAQSAEFMIIEQELEEHSIDALKLVAYNYCEYNLFMQTVPDELVQVIDDAVENVQAMDELIDEITGWLENDEAQEAAYKIRASKKLNLEDCKDLCVLANMEDEFEIAKEAGTDAAIESIINIAAEKLGVEV